MVLRQRERVLGLALTCVDALEPAGTCEVCEETLLVEKTVRRRVVTLACGALRVRERVFVCRTCRREDGSRVRVHSHVLRALVPPGDTFGYDVMVRVGLLRYREHRQREEIQQDLKEGYGITVSATEVTVLAHRFLDYLDALHRSRGSALAEALRADGGWPLHVDATGENGRGTLLALIAGWRGWVLDSRRIPTERADQILPCLRDVGARFGAPCAVVRDLGKAMIPAIREYVAERRLRIPVLSCHQHFLADIGEDLLKESHDALRGIFRSCKVRSLLRALARDLGRELGEAIHEMRSQVRDWQEQEDAPHVVPAGRAGLAVVRAHAQWVLDYKADSRYDSFPFDRPWLDFYNRCVRMSRAVDAYLRKTPSDRDVGRLLRRLARVLDRVVSCEEAARVVRTLTRRSALFDELRDVLRIQPRCAEHRIPPRRVLTPKEDMAELRDIRTQLTHWKRSLRERRPSRGPAEDEREAIDLVLEHLDRHGKSLFGHVIHLPASAGGGVRLVERTNQLAENQFRDLKHGERRRSGRKILTQDLENLPASAFLVPNLRHDDYVNILCGSLDNLPSAFAELDAARRGATAGDIATQTVKAPALESASLPTADRRAVRSDGMKRRVLSAATSRAPRWAHGTG